MDASTGKSERIDNESNHKRQNHDLRFSCKSEEFQRQKIETFEPNEATTDTTLYNLPLEMLDIILQKSYLHWILNLSTTQRDEEVIRTLVSVDVCFYQRTTRQRFKNAIWRHLKTLIKIKVQARGAKCTTSMETQLLHQKLKDLKDRTKPWSHQTDKLISQLREEGIEILSSHLNRQTVVVWIWCQSQAALEYIQRLYGSNQLRDVFFEYIQSSISVVISIDGNQFKKTTVVCPISIIFTQSIEIGENEGVLRLTKLRNKICVLCRPPSSSSSSSYAIRVFVDRIPFRLQKTIEVKQVEKPSDFGSSDKENCLYVSDYGVKCVWKITRETDDQHKIIKWLTTDYEPYSMSVSNDGRLLVVNQSSSILTIYGSDAELIRSIQIPRYIERPIQYAVETSIGNVIILHKWMEEEKGESGSSGRESVIKWVISELTRDGQMVVRRFIPSNKTQQLKYPEYLSLDSDDQLFVADSGNGRVILLDSDLKWNRTICPTKEEIEETKIRYPFRLCYDEEKKQLIVGGYYEDGVYVYTLSRN